MNKVVNIDWLQFYCNLQNFQRHPGYEWQKLEYGTQVYKTILEVKLDGVEFAQIVKDPYSGIMKKDFGLVKIKNEILYLGSAPRLISEFFKLCIIVPSSISRIDICCDFQCFADGSSPADLIKRILNNDVWKIGRSKFSAFASIPCGNKKDPSAEDIDKIKALYRKAIDHDAGKWSSHMEQAVLHGAIRDKTEYEYLRFGSNSSEVSAYLYNKSKELGDVKDKPYIRDSWLRNGLTDDCDVWRLEFSVKSANIWLLEKTVHDDILRITNFYDEGDLDTLTDNELELLMNEDDLGAASFKSGQLEIRGVIKERRKHGEVILGDWSKLFDSAILYSAFYQMQQKYFDIRQNTGQVRKDREERLSLFDASDGQYKIFRLRSSNVSNRADKVFLRKLDKLSEDVRDLSKSDLVFVEQVKTKFAEKKDLKEWCATKGIYLDEDEDKRLKGLLWDASAKFMSDLRSLVDSAKPLLRFLEENKLSLEKAQWMLENKFFLDEEDENSAIYPKLSLEELEFWTNPATMYDYGRHKEIKPIKGYPIPFGIDAYNKSVNKSKIEKI